MKLDEIKYGTTPKIPDTTILAEANINYVDKDEHFIGMKAGTKQHKRMKDAMEWTKESDPALYNKIMDLN